MPPETFLETPPDTPVIVWFRNDLRLSDNPALDAACRSGAPVIGLYVLDDETDGEWKPGGASRWWLHHSLTALCESLRAHGAQLVLRRGRASDIVRDVVNKTGVRSVFWNRRYDPAGTERDRAIKAELNAEGIAAESFNASLLFEPWTIETKTGGFYKVYTRYWHACRDKGDPPHPISAPETIFGYDGAISGERLEDWHLAPTDPDWAQEFSVRWQPGEAGAMARLDAFLENIGDYPGGRDFPAMPATSNLSPHLHFGEIGPRQVWQRTLEKTGWTQAAEKFLKEIVWREFAYHVFYHLPDLPRAPMYEKFRDFPWEDDPAGLKAWQTGKTGYPMVDAGMRELWQTGHMHNRVRMIAGSFLVKHLLLPWQAGEAWFWDTLVDADLAVNAFSWQWIGGCGADAAPYFRIFNPITQGEKFDPKGDYIRRFVPELAALPDKYLHKPWEAPADILAKAGVTLGATYPYPVIDHKRARDRALAAFKSLPKADAS